MLEYNTDYFGLYSIEFELSSGLTAENHLFKMKYRQNLHRLNSEIDNFVKNSILSTGRRCAIL